MKYEWIFFDLDGTLINTLPDLTAAMNKALEINNIKLKYKESNMRLFIGSGSLIACKRALGSIKLSDTLFTKFYNDYVSIYNQMSCLKSEPFKGVIETLTSLKEKGYKLAVFSNKPDRDTKNIIKFYFNDLFDAVRGQVDGIPIKPDKSGYLELKKDFTIDDNKILYVGDMINDYEFSKNLGCDFFYCSFGYDINHLVTSYTKELKSFKDLLQWV